MSPTTSAADQTEADIAEILDHLAGSTATQSNCMFQLALMVARIAVEPCLETYKAEAAQTLMDLIRAKPKSNVVRLFGTAQAAEASAPPAARAAVVHLAARS